MKCKYEGFGVWEGRCVGTTEVDPCIGYEKCSRFRGDYQSNADHIRSMSDEELANLLCTADWCETCDQMREEGTCKAMELDGPLNKHCVSAAL